MLVDKQSVATTREAVEVKT